MPIPMTQDERALRDRLQTDLENFKRTWNSMPDDIRLRTLGDLRDMAVNLHLSLANHGHEPRHHGYMVQNRGVDVHNRDFYYHIHPIEDLIKFTYDEHANDDPQDATLDHEFEFVVYSRRWDHEDKYLITRTQSGWYFQADIYGGPCDKQCAPMLYKCLQHDSVQYPYAIGEWFEWLWEQAKGKGLRPEDVQQGLNEISQWIRTTEQNTPVDGIWQGLA